MLAQKSKLSNICGAVVIYMSKMDLTIQKKNGYYLNAQLYATGDDVSSTPIVILCHGFTGDKFEWGRFPKTAEELNKNGIDALLFDFSGSGENERIPVTLPNQVEDLEEVVIWTTAQGYSRIGTIGLSFGGITSLLANLPDRNAAVFWAPAFYMKRVMKLPLFFLANLFGKLRKKPIKRNSSGKGGAILIDRTFTMGIKKLEHQINPTLANSTIPSLIVQGIDDPVVKVEITRDAFALMPQNETHEMIEVAGATHDFKEQHLDEFIEHSIAWFKQYL